MSMIGRRLTAIAFAALIPLSLAVCGDDDPTDIETPPPEETQMGVVTGAVHDSAAVLPPGRTEQAPADSVDYAGTLSGSAQVEIYSDADATWRALGDPVDVLFEMYCLETAVIHADASVPVGSYSKVRITLAGFSANVRAGGTLDGILYADAQVILISAADAEVVVEKDVAPFTVTTENSTWVVFDLNSEHWLDTAAVTGGTALAADIQSATLVYVTQQ
jgi:hypothetical protein